MQTMEIETLVISLIKDDLIHLKTMNILTDLGLKTTYYDLYLGDTIFNLLGFEDDRHSDEVFEAYVALKEKARYINIASDGLDDLAKEIFGVLKQKAPH